VDAGEGTEKAKDIQQPQNNSDHNDTVEDRLDSALHGDEAVHKPQQDADRNQNQDNVDQGHKTSLDKEFILQKS